MRLQKSACQPTKGGRGRDPSISDRGSNRGSTSSFIIYTDGHAIQFGDRLSADENCNLKKNPANLSSSFDGKSFNCTPGNYTKPLPLPTPFSCWDAARSLSPPLARLTYSGPAIWHRRRLQAGWPRAGPPSREFER